jgi:uracil-DNA glycosylase
MFSQLFCYVCETCRIKAHGLSFSVVEGIAVPASLKVVFKELAEDVAGFVTPSHGCLEKWAGRGVLLLNTILTVE